MKPQTSNPMQVQKKKPEKLKVTCRLNTDKVYINSQFTSPTIFLYVNVCLKNFGVYDYRPYSSSPTKRSRSLPINSISLIYNQFKYCRIFINNKYLF